MSSKFNSNLLVEIRVNTSNPELLKGLDVWLNLGLINETQVKRIAQQYLSCAIPVILAETKPKKEPEIVKKTIPIKQPSFLTQVWQSFKAELSVRWLLFLGVFLVVVSSGVFAATLWQKFPAVGQYLILFTYTIIFWGIGFRLKQQANLSLTSQTLQTIGLLLIPVNFWAMDSFNLWRYPWEWLAGGIAAIILSIIASRQRNVALFNFLALSYLHWGWNITDFPLIAVYLGVIFTAIMVRILPRRRETAPGFVIYALAILLLRGIFVAYLPIEDLALAIGICGWLFTGLAFTRISASPVNTTYQVIGATLLFFGWVLSLQESIPFPATIISGLALHFCSQRLVRYWLRRDLLASFLIGLQELFLIKELIPLQLRNNAINLSIQVAHSEAFPQSVFGVTLFPYLIFFLWLAHWLHQQDKLKLANFGEFISLSFGIILTCLSLFNPTWRSLNLLFSTLTLAYLTHHPYPLRLPFLYFSHLFALLTISATINWQFSFLTQEIWGLICLGLMVIEWSVSLLKANCQNPWYRSCWYFGFSLASLSYMLFLSNFSSLTSQFWLLTPLTLTLIAIRNQENSRQQAAFFSCVALLMAQCLTIWQPESRLVGLGVATGLMLVNTRYLNHIAPAFIHLGFGFSFLVAVFWEKLSFPSWFIFGAIAVNLFWLLRYLLRQQEFYPKAADIWAIALVVAELSLLTKTVSLSPTWEYLAASLLIGGAIITRYWRQPNDFAMGGLIWGGEICLIESIKLMGASTLTIATANVILALVSLAATQYLINSNSRFSSLITLQALPLIYAILGIVYRLDYFTAYTGFITLGAAFTGIGTGYRRQEWKFISYLSLATLSLGIYELVIYQMSQASGGSMTDAFTILAIVAALIALAYRIFVWFWYARNHKTFLNFSLEEIKVTAHLHWAIGSILKVISATMVINSPPQLKLLSFAVNFSLSAYALIQGRDNRNKSASDWWVYVGLVEIIATTLSARLIWTQLAIIDPWRVVFAAIIALFIYQLPWQSWGWQTTPFHRTALVIPALAALVSNENITPFSLPVVAAFYARIAWQQKNIRWSYLTVGFVDWAIARFLMSKDLTDLLFYATFSGLSLLYIAQFEPSLNMRQRHYLRIFGTGIICLTALLLHQDTGIIPALMSLAFIFAGLALRIRAFLYVGTTTFILTGFYQLVVLIFAYSFLKWVIGLIAGILLITIAANFEQRRDLILSLIQNWFEELSRWE